MKTIVGFLSRSHGLEVLENLIHEKNFKILRIYTHSKKPKSEDPNRGIRTDFKLFEDICNKNEILLTIIDEKNQDVNQCPSCDFIIEVSWRYLIHTKIIDKAKILAFGIHRGKLPEYVGAEPIKQALINHEKNIVISAHHLSSKIDEGKTIFSINHQVNYKIENSIEKNIQRLRDEITPLFSNITKKVLKKFS